MRPRLPRTAPPPHVDLLQRTYLCVHTYAHGPVVHLASLCPQWPGLCVYVHTHTRTCARSHPDGRTPCLFPLCCSRACIDVHITSRRPCEAVFARRLTRPCVVRGTYLLTVGRGSRCRKPLYLLNPLGWSERPRLACRLWLPSGGLLSRGPSWLAGTGPCAPAHQCSPRAWSGFQVACRCPSAPRRTAGAAQDLPMRRPPPSAPMT